MSIVSGTRDIYKIKNILYKQERIRDGLSADIKELEETTRKYPWVGKDKDEETGHYNDWRRSKICRLETAKEELSIIIDALTLVMKVLECEKEYSNQLNLLKQMEVQ